MKNAAERARNLKALLKRGAKRAPPELPDEDDPLSVLIVSFLLWESSTPAALRAYRRFKRSFVDYNDLRVSLPHEITEWLGMRDALALERSQRLRATLNDLFRRENAVTLDKLYEGRKREVREYLEGLEGMTPYVSARIALLAFDAHAIPVDEQLRMVLIANDAADDAADVVETSQWLARHIKASDARRVHFFLQRLCDQAAKKAGPRTTPAGQRPNSKKTAAKETASAPRGVSRTSRRVNKA